jgi:hypothetical protein
MKYVIFDLDNCLADDRERIKLIDWNQTTPDLRYAAYHRDCGNDPAGNWHFFSDAIRHATPVFLTARPYHETVHGTDIEQETRTWLHNYLGQVEPLLLMRNVNDHRPSVDVKREQVLELHDWDIKLEDVVCAYDDRPEIVEMYRDFGLEAQVLKIHDVCAYQKPKQLKMDVVRELKRAPDFLIEGAETFRERNAAYGDTYLDFGRVCAALFPDGIHVDAGDLPGFNRLGVLVQAISKIARYSANINTGGHQDSAHDLMVYAAMLEEVTK